MRNAVDFLESDALAVSAAIGRGRRKRAVRVQVRGVFLAERTHARRMRTYIRTRAWRRDTRHAFRVSSARALLSGDRRSVASGTDAEERRMSEFSGPADKWTAEATRPRTSDRNKWIVRAIARNEFPTTSTSPSSTSQFTSQFFLVSVTFRVRICTSLSCFRPDSEAYDRYRHFSNRRIIDGILIVEVEIYFGHVMIITEVTSRGLSGVSLIMILMILIRCTRARSPITR